MQETGHFGRVGIWTPCALSAPQEREGGVCVLPGQEEFEPAYQDEELLSLK